MASLVGAFGASAQNLALQAVRPPSYWMDGLCDCASDCGVCCQTIWCTLCTGANVNNMISLNMPACDCSAFCCIMIGTYVSGNWYPIWLTRAWRRELIQRYNIVNETSCDSCCKGMFCSPCSACQTQREMGKRGQFAGGCCATAPVAQPGMAETAMNFGKEALGKFIGTPTATGFSGLWQSGLCDCTCMEFCETFFCPCVVLGYVSNRIDMDLVDNYPKVETMSPAACCGSLWDLQGWAFANRREIIEKYYIKEETHTGSLWRMLCCPCCAIMQQRREMGYFGQWPGGLCVKEAPPLRR
jgi:Cys-rich protein (TIGR01571 family)